MHDGQMIQVWRKARAYSGGFPNSKRGRDIDFELKYEAMNVQWKGDWSRDPLSFDIFEGVPHLVLYIKDPQSCEAKARTDYSAQFLRWVNGQWVEVKQADFPVDRASLNLHSGYWGHSTADDAKGLITWDTKAERNSFYRSEPDTIKAFFERGKRFCSRFTSN